MVESLRSDLSMTEATALTSAWTLPAAAVVAFAYDFAVIDYHGTYHRIWRRVAESMFRKLDGTSHKSLVYIHR